MLLTVPAGTLSVPTQKVLDFSSGSINSALMFGGTGAIASGIDPQVGNAISGPAGFDQASNPTNLQASKIIEQFSAQMQLLREKPADKTHTLNEIHAQIKAAEK
jgi:hypothetical protein